MSKIYEALRQAEMDRANSSVAESEVDQAAAGQDTSDPAPVPVYSSGVRTLTTVPPLRGRLATRPPRRQSLVRRYPLTVSPTLVSILRRSTFPVSPRLSGPPRSTSFRRWKSEVVRWSSFAACDRACRSFATLTRSSLSLSPAVLPQEGKSFVAANLAISFARHKAGRVLLIDGDMRRATLHKLLGCPQGPGLTEYLSGDASIVEIMQRPSSGEADRPLPHGLSSLTFIPAGTEHDKAADLSGNRRFERLIVAAAPHFDWIVVDSSPVNLVSDGVKSGACVRCGPAGCPRRCHQV